MTDNILDFIKKLRQNVMNKFKYTMFDDILTEVLPDNTAIAFHWVAKEFKTSIGGINIKRVQNFAQLEPQRTFYVVVHGINQEQINELNKSFSSLSNIKVLSFSKLNFNDDEKKFNIPIEYCNMNVKLSEYWDDMYSKEHTRIHFSNEIDLMKYHLAVSSYKIVGPGKPLLIFDFDTLPVENKKIGEVKIPKGGVLLAFVNEDVDDAPARLDLPVIAVSQEGSEILHKVGKVIAEQNLRNDFGNESFVAQEIVSKIKYENVSNIIRLRNLDRDKGRDEIDMLYNKANDIFKFNGNVRITSDKSWHNSNLKKQSANNNLQRTINSNKSSSEQKTIIKALLNKKQ